MTIKVQPAIINKSNYKPAFGDLEFADENYNPIKPTKAVKINSTKSAQKFETPLFIKRINKFISKVNLKFIPGFPEAGKSILPRI